MKNKKGSIIKLICIYFHKFTKHDIMGLSAEMGFYLLTALFPFLILLFIIATLISNSMQELLLNLISYLPRDMENLITELLTSFKGSMPIIITASVLGLWYMSNVISTLTKAMNRFYGVRETRGYFKLRGIFLLFAITIIVLIFLSFALVVFGQGTHLVLQYLNYLPFISTEKVWDYMRYISVILVIFVSIMIMFKILPNKHLSFREVAAGSALTTAAWCITSYGFSFYINNFSKYHVIYGSLASIFILVTWVYMSALVILIGASINAYWYRLRLAKRIKSSSL